MGSFYPEHGERIVGLSGGPLPIATESIEATIFATGTDGKGLYVAGPVVQLTMRQGHRSVTMQFAASSFRDFIGKLADVADKQPRPERAPPIHEA